MNPDFPRDQTGMSSDRKEVANINRNQQKNLSSNMIVNSKIRGKVRFDSKGGNLYHENNNRKRKITLPLPTKNRSFDKEVKSPNFSHRPKNAYIEPWENGFRPRPETNINRSALYDKIKDEKYSRRDWNNSYINPWDNGYSTFQRDNKELQQNFWNESPKDDNQFGRGECNEYESSLPRWNSATIKCEDIGKTSEAIAGEQYYNPFSETSSSFDNSLSLDSTMSNLEITTSNLPIQNYGSNSRLSWNDPKYFERRYSVGFSLKSHSVNEPNTNCEHKLELEGNIVINENNSPPIAAEHPSLEPMKSNVRVNLVTYAEPTPQLSSSLINFLKSLDPQLRNKIFKYCGYTVIDEIRLMYPELKEICESYLKESVSYVLKLTYELRESIDETLPPLLKDRSLDPLAAKYHIISEVASSISLIQNKLSRQEVKHLCFPGKLLDEALRVIFCDSNEYEELNSMMNSYGTVWSSFEKMFESYCVEERFSPKVTFDGFTEGIWKNIFRYCGVDTVANASLVCVNMNEGTTTFLRDTILQWTSVATSLKGVIENLVHADRNAVVKNYYIIDILEGLSELCKLIRHVTERKLCCSFPSKLVTVTARMLTALSNDVNGIDSAEYENNFEEYIMNFDVESEKFIDYCEVILSIDERVREYECGIPAAPSPEAIQYE